MKLHPFLPQVASATFAVVLFIGSGLLHAETAQAASPSSPTDFTAALPQPDPWLLVAAAVAVCISRVRWRSRRRLV